MRFRELANCPSNAYPASEGLQNLIPSWRGSKTEECETASQGTEKVSSLKKKCNRLIANTL